MSKGFRIALMCAEEEPLECHRTILVARHLAALGIDVQHILANGKLESHADALRRLSRMVGLPEEDSFARRKSCRPALTTVRKSALLTRRNVCLPRVRLLWAGALG